MLALVGSVTALLGALLGRELYRLQPMRRDDRFVGRQGIRQVSKRNEPCKAGTVIGRIVHTPNGIYRVQVGGVLPAE